MKHIINLILVLACTAVLTNPASAQTTLAAGDIAILGMNTDNPDDFAFVLLVDIDSGTQIRFTDSGWYETSTAFRGGEGAQVYTAPSAQTAGTVITFSGNPDFAADNDAIVGTNGLNLSTLGDQLLAFQGSSSSPTFIYAIQCNSTAWQTGDPNSASQSALPAGLSDGVNAVSFGAGAGEGDEFDNICYQGGISFVSPAAALAAISNENNWAGDNTVRYDYAVKFGTDISLPVSLSAFSAAPGDGQIMLRWTTESELNNLGFEILRSTAERGAYQLIDSYTFNPALEGQLNSDTRAEYRFGDRQVVNGVTYCYKLVDVSVDGSRNEHGPIDATPQIADGGITTISNSVPGEFKLHYNYPNPFNPSTTLEFDIPDEAGETIEVTILIFNALGQRVRTLVDDRLPPGKHAVNWNARDDAGTIVPGGIYFTLLRTKSAYQVQRMVFLK